MQATLTSPTPTTNSAYTYGGRALVLDSNPSARSIFANQLRDYGMINVVQMANLREARKRLESTPFDVVLCEMDFPGGGPSGSELLEDLRRENLIPLDTVFIMVTGEANYAKVAEAAEAALDSYLLKPFNANILHERLKLAKKRKDELRSIFLAIDAGEFELAATICSEKVKSRSTFWIYAARIGAELWLRLGQHDKARALLEDIVKTKALPWAKLGIARAQLAAQQITPAMRTLESLIASEPTYADAYDVLGRVQIEQGDLTSALETYRRGADLTPGSIARQQKFGLVAFYGGEYDTAAKALWSASFTGLHSKSFDYQGLVLQAFCYAKKGDNKSLRRVAMDLARALERAPMSKRLQRFNRVVTVLELMQAKQVAQVVAEIKDMAGATKEAGFDVEAGCNLLTLLSCLTQAELQLPNAEDWVSSIARRFCTTHGVTELLSSACMKYEPFVELVRERAKEIVSHLENAMNHSVRGDPSGAVKSLIVKAQQTLNPRIMETAGRLLQRHQAKIPEAEMYIEVIQTMKERYGGDAVAPPLGRTQLSPGGLSLRTDRVKPEDEAVEQVDSGLPTS